MSQAIPDFTPVTLLTGFLGSGKTTLLRRLLAEPTLSDTAVIINEFGEVGIDHLLVEKLDEEVALLSSGCLCCMIKGELAATMRDLHSRRARGQIPPFRRVVIESSGLADPAPILSTLSADPVLRHHFLAAGVVATVDAVNGFEQFERRPEPVRQAAIADVIVLTKTDLASSEVVSRLIEAVRAINPTAPLLRGAEEPLDVEAILAPHSGAFRATAEPPIGALAHAGVQAMSMAIDEPIAWAAFGVWLTMLLNRHGRNILRVKGILNLEGEERPVAVHGVGPLVHAPTHLPNWPDDDRRSRLVFIVEGIAPDLIRRSLVAFNRLSFAQAS